MAAEDKHWAKAYVLDPLNAPEPSQETGPGTHFGNTLANDPTKTSNYPTPPDSAGKETPTSFGSNNPFRRSGDASTKSPASLVRAASDASNRLRKPPPSGRHSGQYRQEAFSSYDNGRPRSAGHSHSRNVSASSAGSGNRSRGDSLGQRPLEFARDEAKAAHRSPHMRKQHQPAPDRIDRLDVIGYHHEGPYDAALLARNTSYESSPLAAVEKSNAEALKATPRENIVDSIERHRPLDGVAAIPPGGTDRFGRKYTYEEGDNMMIVDGGNYRRWPGVDYLPEDYKGKGEPSFSIERALKQQKAQQKANGVYEGPAKAETSGIEMEGGPVEEVGVRRSGSKKAAFDGLKKRIGSLRKKPVAEST